MRSPASRGLVDRRFERLLYFRYSATTIPLQPEGSSVQTDIMHGAQDSKDKHPTLMEFQGTHPLTKLNRLELQLTRTINFDPITAFLLEMVSESAYQITLMLIKMWKTKGWIHTSLTTLSHDYSGSFLLLWNKDVSLGLKYFDTVVRSFTSGIRHTNIRVNYASPVFAKTSPFKITLCDFEHVKIFKPDVQGFSYLARMIAEIFILSCLPGFAHRAGDHPFPIDARLGFVYFLDFPLDEYTPPNKQLIGEHIKHGLSCVLMDYGVPATPFFSIWDADNWNSAVEDVADALHTDILRLHRIAKIAEHFVSVLESLIPSNKGQ